MPLQEYGIIYMATSPSGKKYIGQHGTEDFDERKRTHWYNFITYMKEKCILELNRKFYPHKTFPSNPKGYCTALYNAMCKYSFRLFEWEVLVHKVPLDKINDVEDSLIIKHNTLQPAGYNLKINSSSGGRITYSAETRKRMSESSKKKVRDNLHNYRSYHVELEGLPQHVMFYKSKDVNAYKIQGHPKYPGRTKTFSSKTIPVLELKQRVIEFLISIGADLKEETAPVEEKKVSKSIAMRNSDIPKGITKNRYNHYQVDFQIGGKRFQKYFNQEPLEEALKMAKAWMQNTKIEYELDQIFEEKAINEDDYPNGEIDSGFNTEDEDYNFNSPVS